MECVKLLIIMTEMSFIELSLQINLMVTLYISDIKHFIFQLMLSTLKT